MNNATQPPKSAGWKRGGLIALGVVGGLAMLGAVLDPNSGKPVPADPNKADARKVDDLIEAMKPIGQPPLGAKPLTFAIAVPQGARAIDLEAAAKSQCHELAICAVYGWADPNQLPGTWPLLDREVASMTFHYGLNRNTGYEQTDWYCGSPGAKPDCDKPGAE